jgi:DNA-binding transcriptional regulator YdaS (Cro superfamily)
MRFVLGNRLLDHAGGTEVHLLTLAEQLQRLGHEVWLYSPELGPFAEHVRRHGVEVAGELRGLPGSCDVVLSQDALVVYDLAERYPAAFHAFRVCGDSFDFQLAPQLDDIVDLIVVLSDRYERLARACAVKAPVLRLRVPIDADRLAPVAPIRRHPRRAVLLGNYMERDELVREAWGAHGVEVSRIGAFEQRYDLAAALTDVDIVVAKSRAALDAMGCGRAVYVFDIFGGDGWVTPTNYVALEADHFAGQATGRVVGIAELEADLAAYDHRMGIANRDLVAQHHNARDHAIEFVGAVAAHEPSERPDTPLRELARLTALQWSWERLVHDLQGERRILVERVHQTEQRAGEAEKASAASAVHISQLSQELDTARELAASAPRLAERADGLQVQLEEVRATRAWRLATGYWRLRGQAAGFWGRAPQR